MNKLIANIFAKAIGVFVFLFGLLLLSTPVFVVLKVHSDINFSWKGFAIVAFIFFMSYLGFYFMRIGFSILIFKRISSTSLSLLTFIPAFSITIVFLDFIKSLWEKPDKGYSFLSVTVLSVLYLTVFLTSFAVIESALTSIFRKSIKKTW